MRSNWISGSVFTNKSDGMISLKEKIETAFILGDATYVVANTVTYPVMFALSALAQLYLGINWSIHRYKSWRLENKIQRLDQIDIKNFIKNRLEKLDLKNQKLKTQLEKLKNEITKPETDYSDSKLSDVIQNGYIKALAKIESGDACFENCGNLILWENRLEIIRGIELISKEKDFYEQKLDEPKQDEKIKQMLEDKYKFAQLRHQIDQHLDRHYIRNLFIAQIPVIGIIYLAHSEYTVKQSLEKTDLISEYNNYMQTYSWFKQY